MSIAFVASHDTIPCPAPEGCAAATIGDLFREHRSAVLRFALRHAGNLADAEDVTQEAFTRAIVSLPTDLKASPRTYLCAIVKHLCADRRRWDGRRTFQDVDVADIEAGTTPADDFDRHEARAVFTAAIDDLTPTTRRVVRLVIEDVPRDQIAARLGMSVLTVRWHEHAARAALRTRTA